VATKPWTGQNQNQRQQPDLAYLCQSRPHIRHDIGKKSSLTSKSQTLISKSETLTSKSDQLISWTFLWYQMVYHRFQYISGVPRRVGLLYTPWYHEFWHWYQVPRRVGSYDIIHKNCYIIPYIKLLVHDIISWCQSLVISWEHSWFQSILYYIMHDLVYPNIRYDINVWYRYDINVLCILISWMIWHDINIMTCMT